MDNSTNNSTNNFLTRLGNKKRMRRRNKKIQEAQINELNQLQEEIQNNVNQNNYSDSSDNLSDNSSCLYSGGKSIFLLSDDENFLNNYFINKNNVMKKLFNYIMMTFKEVDSRISFMRYLMLKTENQRALKCIYIDFFFTIFIDLLLENKQPHLYFQKSSNSEAIEVTDKIFSQPVYDEDGKFIPFQI